MADPFITVDTQEASAAIGALMAIPVTVKTDRYASAVIVYSHGLMAREFNDSLDLVAATDPKRYHHVYEWDEVGVPTARLWRHVLKGHGGKRDATWQFLASKKPVPTPAERATDPGDPTSFVPEEVIAKLSNKTYFFTWKAPVMEYKETVYARPVNVESMFVPVGKPNGRYYFSKNPIQITNSGGELTTGVFTAFWTQWWTQTAPQVFNQKVRETIENDLGRLPVEEIARKYRRAKTKTVQITTVADSDRAFAVGQKAASEYLVGRMKSYEAMGDDLL